MPAPTTPLRNAPNYNSGNVSGRNLDEYEQLNSLIKQLAYEVDLGTLSGNAPKNPATSRARLQIWPSGPIADMVSRGPEGRAADIYNNINTLSMAPDVRASNAVKQIQQLELLRTMGNLPDLNLEDRSGGSGKRPPEGSSSGGQGAKSTKAAGSNSSMGLNNLVRRLGSLVDLLAYSGDAHAPMIYDPMQYRRDSEASVNPAAAKQISNRAFQANDNQLIDEVARFIVQQQNGQAQAQTTSNPDVKLSPATTMLQDLFSRGR